MPDEARRYFQAAADHGNPAAAAWMGVDLASDHDGRKSDPLRAERYQRLAMANAARWQALSARYSLTKCAYSDLQPVIADATAQQAGFAAAVPAALTVLTELEAHPLAYDAERAERAGKRAAKGRAFEFMGFEDSAPAQDLAQAFALYGEAAALGDGWAALNVANFFAHGRAGVPRDEALAKRWRAVGRTLLAGAAPFDGDLAEDFGIALIDGPDAQKGYVLTANQWLDRDVAAGIQVLQTAAITNHPHAAAMLGPLYNGDRYPAIGIPHDDKLYAAWNDISDQLLNDEDPKIQAAGLAAAKKLVAERAAVAPGAAPSAP